MCIDNLIDRQTDPSKGTCSHPQGDLSDLLTIEAIESQITDEEKGCLVIADQHLKEVEA